MSDELDAYYQELGKRGRLRIPEYHDYTVDEVLRGICPSDPRYAFKMMLDVYRLEQLKVGFTVGDIVKVKPEYVESMAKGGWSGYQAMFHDCQAEVVNIAHSSFKDRWHVDVQYDTVYYYTKNRRIDRTPAEELEIYVKEGPRVFMMWPDWLINISKEPADDV